MFRFTINSETMNFLEVWYDSDEGIARSLLTQDNATRKTPIYMTRAGFELTTRVTVLPLSWTA